MQNQETNLFDGVFYNPAEKFAFTNPRPSRPKSLKIYEAHVGMSQEHGKVATYREFADHVLPHVAECGYNCV